jgi:endonuclease YncB( thermonuclease family)
MQQRSGVGISFVRPLRRSQRWRYQSRVLTAAKQQIRVQMFKSPLSTHRKKARHSVSEKLAMSDLVFGKDVNLQAHSVDRYGRLVAQVFVDGQDAGLELWNYSNKVVAG